MAMAGQRQSKSGRRRNAARRAGAAAALAAGQRRSGKVQLPGAAADGSRQEQGTAVLECSLDVVTPAEIDRVIAAYQRNAEPEVAARMNRKLAEEIIRDSKARIRDDMSERIDYNRRVGIPRDLIRAYGLQLA